MYDDIPVGDFIKNKLKEQERSMAWLAKKVNLDSSNFYKKLKHNIIEIELLRRISKILKDNFFTHCADFINDEISL